MSSPGQIQLKTGGDDAMMRQGHHNSGKESGGVTFQEKTDHLILCSVSL